MDKEARTRVNKRTNSGNLRAYKAELVRTNRRLSRLEAQFSAKSAPPNFFNVTVVSGGDPNIRFDQTANDFSLVLALLRGIPDLAGLGLAQTEASKLEAELSGAMTELEKANPDKSIVCRSVGFVQEIAAEALKAAARKLGESAVTGEWQTWLQRLAQLAIRLHYS